MFDETHVMVLIAEASMSQVILYHRHALGDNVFLRRIFACSSCTYLVVFIALYQKPHMQREFGDRKML